jgi:hypothetical protein
MIDVNNKLKIIKAIGISSVENENLKEITALKALVKTNTDNIASNGGRIGNIEYYLERTDNDGTDDEAIKFSLDIP